jgi:16S rRNA processing protein RimM
MDIGLILGAFGINGEVRIMSLNDEPERFLGLECLTIVGPDGSESVCRVERARTHKGFALVKLDTVATRQDADALRQRYVRLADGEQTVAEETRVVREKLVGLEVFTAAGDRLGVLEEVILTGANDVYQVRDGKHTILLPAISDVVKSVDFEAGRMIVELLPGLL